MLAILICYPWININYKLRFPGNYQWYVIFLVSTLYKYNCIRKNLYHLITTVPFTFLVSTQYSYYSLLLQQYGNEASISDRGNLIMLTLFTINALTLPYYTLPLLFLERRYDSFQIVKTLYSFRMVGLEDLIDLMHFDYRIPSYCCILDVWPHMLGH